MVPVPASLRITQLSESALRIDLSDSQDSVLPLSNILREDLRPSVRDIVPSYEVLVIHFDNELVKDISQLSEWIHHCFEELDQVENLSDRVIEIPVLYNETYGEDLHDSANRLGLSVDELIDLHTKPEYRVRMLGFMPGFPYLEGMLPQLELPRRSVPRKQVLAGSVGIGGNQTGVYPLASPGGWNLIGQTPLSLFNPHVSQPTLLREGDRVRFQSITKEEFGSLQREKKLSSDYQCDLQKDPVIEILAPGQRTIIVDEGRWGNQHLGVSTCGPMDLMAAKLANKLVNNETTDTLVECNLVGPKVRFLKDAVVAVSGAEVEGITNGRPFMVQKGEVLNLEAITCGARSYLAIQGGFAVDRVLGSCGTDLRGQFGGYKGRSLQKGDKISRSRNVEETPAVINPNWQISPRSLDLADAEDSIRFFLGPQADWFDDDAFEQILNQPLRIGTASDSTGIRLECERPINAPSRSMLSEPAVIGAIQVPPSGEPIILMADRQTVGGYPVIGVVASADIGRLSQLRPGATLRLSKIELSDAIQMRQEVNQNFRIACRGIELHG